MFSLTVILGTALACYLVLKAAAALEAFTSDN
jgi:hypothetical protein